MEFGIFGLTVITITVRMRLLDRNVLRIGSVEHQQLFKVCHSHYLASYTLAILCVRFGQPRTRDGLC